jgi:hypothetical protein
MLILACFYCEFDAYSSLFSRQCLLEILVGILLHMNTKQILLITLCF